MNITSINMEFPIPAFNKAVNYERDPISRDGDKARVGEPPGMIKIILDCC